MGDAACPLVPLSWGELLDKITILDLKRERIADPRAVGNVNKEYGLLSRVASPVMRRTAVVLLIEQLREVNASLWDIEEAIRQRETDADFGPEFIRLARCVYKSNDRRAALKREINILLDSPILEEKSYHARASSLSGLAVRFQPPSPVERHEAAAPFADDEPRDRGRIDVEPKQVVEG